MTKKIGMLGSGAYALALTDLLCSSNNEVIMWTRFPDECDSLIEKGLKTPITTDLQEAVRDKDLLIIAIPSNFVEELVLELKPYIDNDNILIASKGLNKDGNYLSDVIQKHLNTEHIAVISGGSFAKDILTKNIFGLSLATKSEELRNLIAECFKADYLHLDYTDDLEGVEFCGVYKNVIAMATGILEGKNLPESTKKYYLYRAILELKKILEQLGSSDTLLSSAGICDLLLTATTKDSRNYTFGTIFSTNNEEAQEYLKETTVEGIDNLKEILLLLNKKNIESEMLMKIEKVIFENNDYKTLLS